MLRMSTKQVLVVCCISCALCVLLTALAPKAGLAFILLTALVIIGFLWGLSKTGGTKW